MFSVNIIAKERLPTRPQYIKSATISLEAVENSDVIPTVIPTVPTAEKASKSTSCDANMGCRAIITALAERTSVRFTATTAEARTKAFF